VATLEAASGVGVVVRTRRIAALDAQTPPTWACMVTMHSHAHLCHISAPSISMHLQISPEEIKAAVTESIKANEQKIKEERCGVHVGPCMCMGLHGCMACSDTPLAHGVACLNKGGQI
jgi:hypothetical protein